LRTAAYHLGQKNRGNAPACLVIDDVWDQEHLPAPFPARVEKVVGAPSSRRGERQHRLGGPRAGQRGTPDCGEEEARIDCSLKGVRRPRRRSGEGRILAAVLAEWALWALELASGMIRERVQGRATRPRRPAAERLLKIVEAQGASGSYQDPDGRAGVHRTISGVLEVQPGFARSGNRRRLGRTVDLFPKDVAIPLAAAALGLGLGTKNDFRGGSALASGHGCL